MLKKWVPAIKIFAWEFGGFFAAFLLALIIFLIYRFATNTLHGDLSQFYNSFFLKFLAPILVGMGSILGDLLSVKTKIPCKQDQIKGTVIFVILNYILFWPGPTETYFSLIIATVLNFAFLSFFLRNLNRKIK